MKRITIPLAFAFALALSACGGEGKVAGSYASETPGLKGVVLTLKPNGKAVYMGAAEFDYEVDGNEVKLHRPDGTLILKVREDGSLDFPLLGNLKKVPS